jgi:hypothetical protein
MLRPQQLDRHPPLEHDVQSPPDLADTAARDQLNQPIPAPRALKKHMT